MDWIVDRRSPEAAESTLTGVETHLRAHAAAEAGVAEAARAVRRTVEAQPGSGALWLHLEWPRMTLQPMAGERPAGAVPLRQRASLPDPGEPSGVTVELGLERRALDSFGDGPPPMPRVDVDPRRDGVATVAVAFAAAGEAHPAANPAQTATLAGTVLADAVAEDRPTTAAAAAELFVDVHRALGGEAEVLHCGDRSFEVGMTRSPFGPGAHRHPSLCHVWTGVAGRLAAQVTGVAVVDLTEAVELGDDESRLVVVLGTDAESADGELHRWPPTATGVEGPAPHMDFSVSLPSENGSVPVVRRLAAQALRAFGVHDDDVDDVQLAISEACANVVDHARDTDTYEVRFELAADRCAITVLDNGDGFDPGGIPDGTDVDAEHGRGLSLVTALVDRVAFHSEPRDGAVVHMVKTLRYDAEHPLRAGRPDG